MFVFRCWLATALVFASVASAKANSVPFEANTILASSAYMAAGFFPEGSGVSLDCLHSALIVQRPEYRFEIYSALFLQRYRIRMAGEKRSGSDSMLRTFLMLLGRFVLPNRNSCQDDCTRLCEYGHGCTAFQDRPSKH